MKRCVFAVSLMLMLTMAPYARYVYERPKDPGVTDTDGSRDRELHGKARRRARRKQTSVQTDGKV